MLPNVPRLLAITVTSLALAAASVGPAQALGKNERNFLKGVAAAAAVGALLNHSQSRAAPAPQYQEPQYQRPQYQQPQYQHQQTYRPPQQQSQYQRQANVARNAFMEFSPQSRRAIQSRLAAYGYYTGAIDGIWGRGTASALDTYARYVNAHQSLTSRDGTVNLLNGLLS